MDTINTLWILSILLKLARANELIIEPCSEDNRKSSIHACLNEIRNVAAFDDDDQRFWFSSPSSSDGKGINIASRLNMSHNKIREVDSYLNVKYTSKRGSYLTCGNTYDVETEKTFSVDPVSKEVYHSWDTRNMPKLRWHFEKGEHFTLLIFDVGHFLYHGIFFNIHEQDIQGSRIAMPYRGPLLTTDISNPYVFLLFRQSYLLPPEDTAEIEKAILNSGPRFTYHPLDMATKLHLVGPKAMNWVTVTGDIGPHQIRWVKVYGDLYAIGELERLELENHCPSLLTQALHRERHLHNRRFIDENEVLSVSINITYQAEAIEFPSCCENYYFEAKNFSLNPLGQREAKPAEVRSGIPINVTFTQHGTLPSSLTGKQHTLICLDADMPGNVSTEYRPFVHWMLVNIQDGNITKNDTVFPYFGPAPLNYITNTYYFLLYEQTGHINPAALTPTRFSRPNCPYGLQGAGRCTFDIGLFRKDMQLKLVGATWMTARKDEYVRYVAIAYGNRSQEEICSGVLGYDRERDCPTGAGTHVMGLCTSILMSILTVLFLLFVK